MICGQSSYSLPALVPVSYLWCCAVWDAYFGRVISGDMRFRVHYDKPVLQPSALDSARYVATLAFLFDLHQSQS
jgi:hypothetical protein